MSTHALRRLCSASVAVGCCLALVVPGQPAQAAPVRETTRWLPAEADQAIRKYWTPQRMAMATPTAAPTPRPGTLKASTQAGGPSRTVAPALPPAQVGIQNAGAFSFATGKIFYTLNGAPKWCSGGAVNSGKRRLLLTAAHCVHGGPFGTWHPNWMFVPGYTRGVGQRGTFTANSVWFKTAWLTLGHPAVDYAFVATNNNEFGQRLVDAVGAHGLVSNAGHPYVHAAGYPGNRSGGEVQAICFGTTERRNLISNQQELNCPWTPGHSGGPWLRDFNHTNGIGLAITVSSSSPTGGGPPIWGPYFDNGIWSTYNAAENASLP